MNRKSGIIKSKRFTNIDIKRKVNFFNKTITKRIRIYIPHETITCYDRDPPCINKDIKQKTHEKKSSLQVMLSK